MYQSILICTRGHACYLSPLERLWLEQVCYLFVTIWESRNSWSWYHYGPELMESRGTTARPSSSDSTTEIENEQTAICQFPMRKKRPRANIQRDLVYIYTTIKTIHSNLALPMRWFCHHVRIQRQRTNSSKSTDHGTNRNAKTTPIIDQRAQEKLILKSLF